MGISFDHGGQLWIGRHSGDGDTLVFDPDQAASGSYVSLFSLTQFRQRSFPRNVVEERIAALTDEKERAAALQRYREWPTLRAEHERAQQNAAEAEAGRRREDILALHRAYLEERGVPYPGVRDSSLAPEKGAPKPRARTACASCGIKLDDFVGTRCVGCNTVLCSCGACGCSGTPKVPTA
jgi:hypothetical protein